MSIERSSVTVAVAHPDAYDVLGETYDVWCLSVTEDIGFYVDLALASRRPGARDRRRLRPGRDSRRADRRGRGRSRHLHGHAATWRRGEGGAAPASICG